MSYHPKGISGGAATEAGGGGGGGWTAAAWPAGEALVPKAAVIYLVGKKLEHYQDLVSAGGVGGERGPQ